MSRPDRTVTPEAVTISVDVAGLGSRMIAWLIDTVIQLVILVPILIGVGAGDLSGSVELVVLSLVVFLIFWGYYPIFELSWQGRTPGKRAQRLRVVRTDGQPAGAAAIMVRNLIRILDVFLFPFLAVISMIVTTRAQRLGDLAAGTMVVREGKLTAPRSLSLPDRADLPPVDATGLSEREYDVIRSFLVTAVVARPVGEVAARRTARCPAPRTHRVAPERPRRRGDAGGRRAVLSAAVRRGNPPS